MSKYENYDGAYDVRVYCFCLTLNVRIGWYVGGEVMIKVVVVYNVVDDVGC